MVWYQHLNRTTPYMKNYRRWNMWYDFNNPKHHEISIFTKLNLILILNIRADEILMVRALA